MRDEGAAPTGDQGHDAGQANAAASPAVAMTGVLKWFDATRGFGFVVADPDLAPDMGDVLIHFTVLQAFGRRTLPEGARIEGFATRGARGWHATEITAIDVSSTVETVRERDRERLGVETGELPKDYDIRSNALAVQTLMIGINTLSKVVHSEKSLWLACEATLKGLDLLEKGGQASECKMA